MKIFNKFIWSKKKPSNKNDIWFDGSTWRMYTEEAWQSFTLPVDAADKVAKVIENASEVFQEKLTEGEGIVIEDNTISIIIDPKLSETSNNPVQNKTVTKALKEKINKTELATINGKSIIGSEDIIIKEGKPEIIIDFEKLGEPIESEDEGTSMKYSKEQFENAVGMSMSEFFEKSKTSEIIFSVYNITTIPYYIVFEEFRWIGYCKMPGLISYVIVIDTESPNEYMGLSVYYETADLPFATIEYVDEKNAQVEDKLTELEEEMENINPTPMLSVTYAELVALRDNGELIAGMQYRITDYVTTTAQENTQSAGHQFDVIVTADNATTLNEVARACLHEGDTYFSSAGAKLEAWKIWYCLDNDAERFAWADAENGKGVIYRMIDEWNNDLPYDFKNIMFKRYELNAPELYETSTNGYWMQKLSENIRAMFNSGNPAFIWSGLFEQDKYWETDNEEVMSTPTGRSRFFYTFSDDSDIPYDSSLGGTCCDNVMLSSYRLPNNVFFGGGEQYNNRFGFYCNDNSISYDCSNNTFGSECYENCFGTASRYNTFGNICCYNSLGYGCEYNNFGNLFKYNSLGDRYCINSFGNDCRYNSFGTDCYSNSFGNSCSFNSFGSYCNYISFGNECSSNSFNDCEGLAHNVQHVTLENHVYSIKFYFDDTPDAYEVIQYIHVYSGVNNDNVFVYADSDIVTFCAVDLKGVIHSFNILDFKNS